MREKGGAMSDWQSPLMRASPRGCGWFFLYCLILVVVFFLLVASALLVNEALGGPALWHEYELLGGFWLGVRVYGGAALIGVGIFGPLWLCATALERLGRRFGWKE